MPPPESSLPMIEQRMRQSMIRFLQSEAHIFTKGESESLFLVVEARVLDSAIIAYTLCRVITPVR
jgi:hypothetical protein